MMYLYLFITLLLVGLIVYIFPLLAPKRSTLPILLFSKIGKPFPASKDAAVWLSEKRLERLFTQLQKRQFNTVLPADIVLGQLPKKAICLCFSGGYQSFYTLVFPLLQKYQFKALVCLPVAHLGQYDAWEKEGPWQSLLTTEQLQQLKQSGLVAFAVQAESNEQASDLIWQYQEYKSRLENIYQLPVQTAFVKVVLNEQDHQTLAATYPLLITAQHALPVAQRTNLQRLLWKLSKI